MRQALRAGALGRPRGMGWRGRREGGSGWGTRVNPWLIHVNVWQKPLQYCKAISLQLIKINEKLKTASSVSRSCGLTSCSWADLPRGPLCGCSLRTTGAAAIQRLDWAVFEDGVSMQVSASPSCTPWPLSQPCFHVASPPPGPPHVAWVCLTLSVAAILREAESGSCQARQGRATLGVSMLHPPYSTGRSTRRTPGRGRWTPFSDKGVKNPHLDMHAGQKCCRSQT